MNQPANINNRTKQLTITRHSANPIVTPGQYPWRSVITFNPGVIYDNGKFHMLERAGGSLRPMKCQIGLLESSDGFHFTHTCAHPVLTPEQLGCPQGTIEDPRVVKIDGFYYMTFAHRPFTFNCFPTGAGVPEYQTLYMTAGDEINNTRSGIARSENLMDWEFVGFTNSVRVDDRDTVLFPEKINGKFVLLRRPLSYFGPEFGCKGPSIWLTSSEDLKLWDESILVAGAMQAWEGQKIGAAAPPVRTSQGWLLLYHGVDQQSVYRVGAMLLDLESPQHVVARSKDFIMEPVHYYEKFGLVIPNVIFPGGLVEKDGTLYIYYGCTDTCISVATVAVQDMLDYLLQQETL